MKAKVGHNFTLMSPFAVSKGIQVYVSKPVNVKKLKSGDLLVEVDNEKHSKSLLAATKLVSVPVEVSPHRSLNEKRGSLDALILKIVQKKRYLKNYLRKM